MPRNRKVWPYEYRCPQCGAEYTAPEANRRKHVTKVRNSAYTETIYETGMRSRTLFPGQVPIPRGPRKVQVPASTSTIFHGYKCWDCEAILRKIDPSEQFVGDSDEDEADLEKIRMMNQTNRILNKPKLSRRSTTLNGKSAGIVSLEKSYVIWSMDLER